MVNQFNAKAETVSGRLLQFFDIWKVQSSYGTFPLSKSLQSKPTVDLNGSWVGATVKCGEVTDYHLENESIDTQSTTGAHT